MSVRKICKASGCCRLADEGSKYCSSHKNLEARDRELHMQGFFTSANHGMWKDLYNCAKWKAMRTNQLRNYPCCQICGREATEVHHLQPHNGNLDLFFDENNLISICHECHTKETLKEAKDRQKPKKTDRKLWY